MFEIKDSSQPHTKRLIIYMDMDKINSIGFKVTKEDLYQLYSLLRQIFSDSE